MLIPVGMENRELYKRHSSNGQLLSWIKFESMTRTDINIVNSVKLISNWRCEQCTVRIYGKMIFYRIVVGMTGTVADNAVISMDGFIPANYRPIDFVALASTYAVGFINTDGTLSFRTLQARSDNGTFFLFGIGMLP